LLTLPGRSAPAVETVADQHLCPGCSEKSRKLELLVPHLSTEKPAVAETKGIQVLGNVEGCLWFPSVAAGSLKWELLNY